MDSFRIGSGRHIEIDFLKCIPNSQGTGLATHLMDSDFKWNHIDSDIKMESDGVNVNRDYQVLPVGISLGYRQPSSIRTGPALEGI